MHGPQMSPSHHHGEHGDQAWAPEKLDAVPTDGVENWKELRDASAKKLAETEELGLLDLKPEVETLARKMADARETFKARVQKAPIVSTVGGIVLGALGTLLIKGLFSKGHARHRR